MRSRRWAVLGLLSLVAALLSPLSADEVCSQFIFDASTATWVCSDPIPLTGGSGSPCDAYPVGALYLCINSANPATSLGCGTWSAFGAGRVLVGVDAGDPDYDTAEETSGSKTVTLTTDQLPSHAHGVTDPGHTHLTQRYPTATGGSSGFTIDTSMSGTLADNTLPTKSGTTGVTVNSTGNGQSVNVTQPSIAVFMWKRVS